MNGRVSAEPIYIIFQKSIVFYFFIVLLSLNSLNDWWNFSIRNRLNFAIRNSHCSTFEVDIFRIRSEFSIIFLHDYSKQLTYGVLRRVIIDAAGSTRVLSYVIPITIVLLICFYFQFALCHIILHGSARFNLLRKIIRIAIECRNFCGFLATNCIDSNFFSFVSAEPTTQADIMQCEPLTADEVYRSQETSTNYPKVVCDQHAQHTPTRFHARLHTSGSLQAAGG